MQNYAAEVKKKIIFLFADGTLIDENNYLETLPKSGQNYLFAKKKN